MWHNNANVNVHEDIGNKIPALPIAGWAAYPVNLNLKP